MRKYKTPLKKHIYILAGFWAQGQPKVTEGECVRGRLTDTHQSWELSTCETLLPFMCRVEACTKGAVHCSNGRCINKVRAMLCFATKAAMMEFFFLEGESDI